MKRQINALRASSTTGTPYADAAGKRLKPEFMLDSPVAGLADAVGASPAVALPPGAAPCSTQKLLANFTLNTPLSQQLAQTPELQLRGPAQPPVPPRSRLSNITNLSHCPVTATDEHCGSLKTPAPQPLQEPVSGPEHLEQHEEEQEEQQQPQQQQDVLMLSPLPLASDSPAVGATPEDANTTPAADLLRRAATTTPSTADGFVLRIRDSYHRTAPLRRRRGQPEEEGGEAAAGGEEDGPQELNWQVADQQQLLLGHQVSEQDTQGTGGGGWPWAADFTQELAREDTEPQLQYMLDTPGQADQEPLRALSSMTYSHNSFAGPLAAAAAAAGPASSVGAAGLHTLLSETTTPELEPADASDLLLDSPRGQGRIGGRPGVLVSDERSQLTLQVPRMFLPKERRKLLMLVRHGESAYNAADRRDKRWRDPSIYDAPLTEKGMAQAQALRGQLGRLLNKHTPSFGEPLWVCSPLTRAMETFLHACPCLDRLTPAAEEAAAAAAAAPPAGAVEDSSSRAGGGSSSGAEEQGAADQGAAGRERQAGGAGRLPLVINSHIAERCMTTGDVGRPASTLRRHFPQLAHAMQDLEEVWWYNPHPHHEPNCARLKRLTHKETTPQLKERVEAFRAWLNRRPERLVVAVGHSLFWKAFCGDAHSMANCEVKLCLH